jgi:hypothetical protein
MNMVGLDFPATCRLPTAGPDIEEARRQSHEPTAVRPELGLGWPEFYTPLDWDSDNLPGRVTRLRRMEPERGEGPCGRGPGAVGPGGRQRLAAGRAEPGHDPRCTRAVGVGNAASDGNGTVENATSRHSPLQGLSVSNRASIEFQTIPW